MLNIYVPITGPVPARMSDTVLDLGKRRIKTSREHSHAVLDRYNEACLPHRYDKSILKLPGNFMTVGSDVWS